MGQAAGGRMRLPAFWNRTRATALFATLLLHLVAAYWLLALRFEMPGELAEELRLLWLPRSDAPPPPPPVASEQPPTQAAPIRAAPLPMPVPEALPATEPDWSRTAREVAKGMTAVPSYQRFGEIPKGPEKRPSEAYPPSIFDKPLPRVGKTVTTAEGETIIWVSDYCYVSISSRSLTQKEIHDSRKGVPTCILAQWGGEKKARDDLFDAIKRPPPPQEPGCNKEGIGQSCGR
jgi:hypothetical protein